MAGGTFFEIFLTSASAISQVALLCGVGFLAGSYPRDSPLLSRSFVKRLATLSLFVFETSLAFYVMASRLSVGALTLYWVVPLWQLPQILAGYTYGKLLISLARRFHLLVDADEEELTLTKVIPVVCSFQNPVAFVLPIFLSLCEGGAENTAPYQGLSGTDASSLCTLDTTLFSFLHFIVWSVVFWLWAYPQLTRLVQVADAPQPDITSTTSMPSQSITIHECLTTNVESSPAQEAVEMVEAVPESAMEGSPAALAATILGRPSGSGLRQRAESAGSSRTAQGTTEMEGLETPYRRGYERWIEESESPWAGGANIEWSLLPHMSKKTARESMLPVREAELDEERNVPAPPNLAGQSSDMRPRAWTLEKVRLAFPLLRTLLQPNLLATFAGIAVGLSGFASELLFEKSTSPLRPLGRALHTLGQPAPLISTLVMSASLAGSFQRNQPQEAGLDSPSHASNNNVAPLHMSRAATTSSITMGDSTGSSRKARLTLTMIPLVVRCLLMPATGLLLVLGCIALHNEGGLAGRIASTLLPPSLPWLHLTILIHWASAPAQTVIVAVARLGLDHVAGSLSRIYLILYSAGMLAVAAVTCVGLALFF